MKRFPSPRVVVVGSSNTDLVVRLDTLPRPGETRLGGALVTAAGGKGANQAVAAARAGGRVTFVARVGRDAFGAVALKGFKAEGIRTTFVRRDAGAPSGVALILVDARGENSIAVAPGANARLAPADVRRARGALQGAQALLLQLETPLATVQAAATLAATAGVPVILNPAPARDLPDRLLRRVSFLTPNETEAEHLTGLRVRDAASARRAARQLLARGVGTVIVTLGARGAFVATPDSAWSVTGFRVKVVDSTAAGDIFNGALAVALGEGQALPDAVRFACAAGALAVTRLGAQRSAPARLAIEKLLSKP